MDTITTGIPDLVLVSFIALQVLVEQMNIGIQVLVLAFILEVEEGEVAQNPSVVVE